MQKRREEGREYKTQVHAHVGCAYLTMENVPDIPSSMTFITDVRQT